MKRVRRYMTTAGKRKKNKNHFTSLIMTEGRSGLSAAEVYMRRFAA